jgi:hypothetical protein
MSKFKLHSSFALLALLALGVTAPVFGDELDSTSIQRLRLAPGTDGVGFGSLVIPTSKELGELGANLYDESDRPVFWLHGSLSLYMPADFAPVGREQFGGFSGLLRSPMNGQGPHPAIVGFVEGTWSLDGEGHGVLRAVAFKVDGRGDLQPSGVITGEFDVIAIHVLEVDSEEMPSGLDFESQRIRDMRELDGQPLDAADEEYRRTRRLAWRAAQAQQDAADSQATPLVDADAIRKARLRYRYLNAQSESQALVELSSDFWSKVQQLRRQSEIDGFGTRSFDLATRIAAARKQAEADGSLVPMVMSQIPVEPHLYGKILIKYKVVN